MNFLSYSTLLYILLNLIEHVYSEENKTRIVLYEDKFYEGNFEIVEVDRCVNILPHFDDIASSVDTRLNCIKLFEHKCCQGGSIEVSPTSPSYFGDFHEVNFNDRASSLSPCGNYSSKPPQILRQALGNDSKLIYKSYIGPQVTVYYDARLNNRVTWPGKLISKLWSYAHQTYNFEAGPEQGHLYAIIHGQQPNWDSSTQTYIDPAGECRNVLELRANNASEWKTLNPRNMDTLSYELTSLVRHLVQGGVQYPWYTPFDQTEFQKVMIYDLYRGLNLTQQTERYFNKAMNASVNFPIEETYWFRDWYHPIYLELGSSMVLRYLDIEAKHFIRNKEWNKNNQMNLGQFIHLWSHIVGRDLKQRAAKVFGWNVQDEYNFVQAKIEYPSLSTY